jgi:hypothetical protein
MVLARCGVFFPHLNHAAVPAYPYRHAVGLARGVSVPPRRQDADTYRDQELSRLFNECEWTQERIAKRMGRSRMGVVRARFRAVPDLYYPG